MTSCLHTRAPTARPAVESSAPMGLVLVIHLVVALVLPVAACFAQAPPTSRVDQQRQHQLIERITTILTERYVIPDVANQLVAALRSAERRGAFITLSTQAAFADSVTTLLRSISRDGHLWIEVSPGAYPESSTPPDPQAAAARRRRLRAMNFGFPRVELLPGNIGYLQVRQFVSPESATDAAEAAFQFLANADALILDLRGSSGGSAEMVALISGHLFSSLPRHLFDNYRRPQDRLDEYWTNRFTPRQRFPHQPVYVLTNAALFSAGEGLAYTLKDLGRVMIVGETTSGGAHLGSFHRLSADLIMFVAEARAISAASRTNWQGVGVIPHVEVPAEHALAVAQLLALDTLVRLDSSDVMTGERRPLAQELRQRLGAIPIIRH